MKNFWVIFIVMFVVLLSGFFTFSQKAYGYVECETGNPTRCNPDNSKTGHWCSVENGTDTDLGQYQCNRPYWGQCGGDFVNGKSPGVCQAVLSGGKSTGQALYGPVHGGDGTACGSQAGGNGIDAKADLYCVCGVGGAAPCPAAASTGAAKDADCSTGQTCSSGLTCTNVDFGTGKGCEPAGWCGDPNHTPPGTACPNGQACDLSSHTCNTPTTNTSLNVALQLPGIGQGGNLSPKHLTRQLHLSIYATGVDPSQPNVTPLYDNKNVTITFNSTNGYFVNDAVDVGTLASDSYQILFKVPGYLRKEITNTSDQTTSVQITGGSTNLVPAAKLIAGDVAALYNVMDIADFYAIVGCYKDKATSSTCSIGQQMADLNDDGVVDGVDLNYWLLGMSTLLQANATNPGSGDGATGD